MTVTTATAACWYVVQTQPNAERKAVAHLERQNFSTYTPRYRKRRRHARRTEIVLAPLFPRYVFVSLDIKTQQWRSIQSTVGVSRLVCHGDRPTLVPPVVIDALQAREGSDGVIDVDSQPRFTRGDKIRVTGGAFGDCSGLFESMTDSERIAILLDLLGRKVRVVLDAQDVGAV